MELIEVGYFSKAHGIKGALVLKNQVEFDWEQLKVLFVEISGNRAPYFVSDITNANQAYIITLEDIDKIEKANPLISKTVFIDAGLFIDNEDEIVWKDFEVIDHVFGKMGCVVSESDNGIQKIIEVMFKGKLVLLPLVEEFIEKIDENKKIIYYNAPEGLIELYLDDSEEN